MYKGEGCILLLSNILTSLLESNLEQFEKLYCRQDNVFTAIDDINVSINKSNEVININN